MDDQQCRISVRVKPRSSKNTVEGWVDDVLVVRLASPPVDGAANISLVKFLSKKAGVARSRVHIVSGEKGRSKVLEFEGIAPHILRDRLK